jgi:iron complex outermembrane receptor protein
VSFRSNFFTSASSETYVPSYALADFSIGLKLDDRSTEFSFWVHNLFDKNYYLSRSVLIFNNGGIQARLGDPRTFGVTFRQQF